MPAISREMRKCMALFINDGVSLSQQRKRNVAYQAIGRRSRKKPPVGPSSGKVASHTVVSAPCWTDRGAADPPMSVRTHPGSTALASTPRPRYVWARIRVNALRAAFDIAYAGAYVDMFASWPAPDDTFTTRP